MKKQNIRNKILSKEEILAIAKEKMQDLKKNFPEEQHFNLINFHNEACKIDSWICEKMKRLEKKNGLKRKKIKT